MIDYTTRDTNLLVKISAKTHADKSHNVRCPFSPAQYLHLQTEEAQWILSSTKADILLNFSFTRCPLRQFLLFHHLTTFVDLLRIMQRWQPDLPQPFGSSTLYHLNFSQSSWQTMTFSNRNQPVKVKRCTDMTMHGKNDWQNSQLVTN